MRGGGLENSIFDQRDVQMNKKPGRKRFFRTVRVDLQFYGTPYCIAYTGPLLDYFLTVYRRRTRYPVPTPRRLPRRTANHVTR